MAIPTALQRAVLHFFELTKYRCVPVQANLKVHLSCRPFLPLADRNASGQEEEEEEEFSTQAVFFVQ